MSLNPDQYSFKQTSLQIYRGIDQIQDVMKLFVVLEAAIFIGAKETHFAIFGYFFHQERQLTFWTRHFFDVTKHREFTFWIIITSPE